MFTNKLTSFLKTCIHWWLGKALLRKWHLTGSWKRWGERVRVGSISGEHPASFLGTVCAQSHVLAQAVPWAWTISVLQLCLVTASRASLTRDILSKIPYFCKTSQILLNKTVALKVMWIHKQSQINSVARDCCPSWSSLFHFCSVTQSESASSNTLWRLCQGYESAQLMAHIPAGLTYWMGQHWW